MSIKYKGLTFTSVNELLEYQKKTGKLIEIKGSLVETAKYDLTNIPKAVKIPWYRRLFRLKSIKLVK